MFEGVYTAIVTPFAGGEVDYGAFEKLIEWQIESGVDGIVPCGTTGESATLTEREHAEVVDFTVRQAKGRVKVIAGTGSNCTRTAIELTLEARKSGADGALLVSPYYNKPTPEGLYQHYLAVSEATPLPLVIYNVPGRTGRNVPAEVVERLAQRENIVAVKEASGDLGQISRLAANTALTILSGDDGLTLPILSVGGRGVISVASNVVPVEIRALVESYLAGDPDKALAVHRKLLALFKALFVETNPIPVKAALAAMGRISEEYRLPLVSMKEENRLELVRVLEKLGLVHATGG
jgi:4-hydroxy-tetrahydrodipicolinate synthase